MHWPALAFRPPTVRNRLRRGSHACPLALRDVLGGLIGEASALPLVWAPSAAVIRAALVAAKEAGSVIGLAQAGPSPERWFEAVAEVADEIAPGLPLLLGATVSAGTGASEGARAFRLAQRLVDAGITHLILEVDALEPARRAEQFARIAEPALERGFGVECLLPGGVDGLPDAEDTFSLLSELASLGASPDLAGVRLPANGDEKAARALERLFDSAGGVGLACRGAGAARAARLVRPGLLRAVDDGGAALSHCEGEGDPERAEARAYGEVAGLIDTLHSEGSAAVLASALERARGE